MRGGLEAGERAVSELEPDHRSTYIYEVTWIVPGDGPTTQRITASRLHLPTETDPFFYLFAEAKGAPAMIFSVGADYFVGFKVVTDPGPATGTLPPFGVTDHEIDAMVEQLLTAWDEPYKPHADVIRGDLKACLESVGLKVE
jgi:hypothetical protein